MVGIDGDINVVKSVWQDPTIFTKKFFILLFESNFPTVFDTKERLSSWRVY